MVAWEGKHDNHKCTQNPPFILHLFAEHAIMLLGTSLWAFWVSCPGSVSSHLAHKVKKEKALVLCKHILWQPKRWCVINAVGHKSRLQHHTGCYEASSPARPLRWDSNQTRKVGNLVSYLVLCSPVVILFQQTSHLSCLLTKVFVFQWSTKKWMKLSLFPLCFCWKDSGFEVLQHTTFLPEPLYPWQSGQLCLDFLYTPIKYWKFEESSLQGFEETWPVGFGRKRSE